jgi:ABC-type spermidine/putrescine transport system permease subunit II
VLIAAHVALVMPFVVRSVWVSVKNLDPMLERAAASLGATPWRSLSPGDAAAPRAWTDGGPSLRR